MKVAARFILHPSAFILCVEKVDDFLARPAADVLRLGVEQVEALHGQRPSVAEGTRRLGFEDELHLRGEFVRRLQPQRHGHAARRAHRVHGERKGRHHAVDRGLFKKQRLAAARRFHLPIRPLGDLQLRRHRHRDTPQLTRTLERGKEGGEGFVSHAATLGGFVGAWRADAERDLCASGWRACDAPGRGANCEAT